MRETKTAAVHASPVAHGSPHKLLRGLLIGLAAAALMAFLGALGTGQAPLPVRLAYWAAVILPGSILGLGARTLVDSWGRLQGSRWLRVGMIALMISVPHSFLVIVATTLFFDGDLITSAAMLHVWTAVLVLSLVLTAINSLADLHKAAPAPEAQPVAAEPIAPPPAVPPILPSQLSERLAPRLRTACLVAVQAEDHYVRIHTELGSDLVLLRMADACALLEGVPGARVHRSWWVARSAVAQVRQQAGRVQLQLSNGLDVPVSRSMQQRVRNGSW